MPVSDLRTLLRTMEPVLHPGVYVFAAVPDDHHLDATAIVATVHEAEGLSVVMEESAALAAGLTPAFHCAWITLTVHSDLEAVGLTAAFSAALARAGISCNVVAGVRHDHLFVPFTRADEALAALRALQREAGQA